MVFSFGFCQLNTTFVNGSKMRDCCGKDNITSASASLLAPVPGTRGPGHPHNNRTAEWNEVEWVSATFLGAGDKTLQKDEHTLGTLAGVCVGVYADGMCFLFGLSVCEYGDPGQRWSIGMTIITYGGLCTSPVQYFSISPRRVIVEFGWDPKGIRTISF